VAVPIPAFATLKADTLPDIAKVNPPLSPSPPIPFFFIHIYKNVISSLQQVLTKTLRMAGADPTAQGGKKKEKNKKKQGSSCQHPKYILAPLSLYRLYLGGVKLMKPITLNLLLYECYVHTLIGNKRQKLSQKDASDVSKVHIHTLLYSYCNAVVTLTCNAVTRRDTACGILEIPL
jgi:hypothetical protein